MLTVHPHVRGEDRSDSEINRSRSGSPPRAWGRRNHSDSRNVRFRFTPTCVGKTAIRLCSPNLRPVHPHVRGEDGVTERRGERCDGSPPRAWGRPAPAPDPFSSLRFTPTCVGKTSHALEISAALAVHPHVRGEDVRIILGALAVGGSPPRAWGRLCLGEKNRGNCRFTPTCVGKTLSLV